MRAQWTADVVGEMHIRGITAKKLSAQLGWNPKYLSTVLNGKRCPKNAESKIKAALADLPTS